MLRPAASPHSNLLSLWVNPALDFDLPIQAHSLHHQVQAFILKASYEGTLGPGDRLNESTISAQLGISRTPVREALTYLESSGLVVRIPRRGFFLATLSAEDAAHCYAMREMLEAYAARTIAGRLSEAQRTVLRDIVDRMEPAVRAGNWPQAAVHNIAFHEAVVGMAGNPVLLRMWTSVGPVLWFFDSLTRRTEEPSAGPGFVQRHEMLLAALTKKNPNAAASAFVAHIDSVKRAVVDRLTTIGMSGRDGDAGTERVKDDVSQRGERE
ncbi:MAG TPA: GntR family transcriptional regulator [bacterium]|nr:GntR family transcriptional regulator [bacterium]